MAQERTSELPAANAADGTELVPVSQVISGTLTSVKMTTQAIANLGGGGGSQDLEDVLAINPSAAGIDIVNLPAPATASSATRRQYVDDGDAAAVVAAGSYTDSSIATEVTNRNSAIASAVTGLWDDRGNFDASVNAYPSLGGSGAAGAILKGDIWTISVAGTLPTGQVVEVGDTIRALTNTPGNTQGNWAIAQNNIGYIPITNVLNSAQILVGSAGNVATAVTMSGDIAITNTGATSYSGTVPVNKGGTNIVTYAVGDLIYASGSTTLSKLAAVAVGSYLGSKGTTTAPGWTSLEYVTPEMFGAVGDGSTDDATAINSAIATGKAVYFGVKNYRIASTITVAADNIMLYGSGNGSIISTTANISIITIGGIGWTVKDIQLLGSNSGSTQRGINATGNGSFNIYRYNTRVENVFANDLGADGFYTTFVIGASTGGEHQGGIKFVNCRAFSCATGFNCDSRGEYSTFSNCHSDNNTTGVKFTGGNNNWIGGTITDNTTGISIVTGTNSGKIIVSGAIVAHNATNISVNTNANYVIFDSLSVGAGNISLVSSVDVKFYNCTLNALTTITINTCTGTEFDNCNFPVNPTWTITASTDTKWLGNNFTAGTPTNAAGINTLQGAITHTINQPSVNTSTATYTTTASGQHGWNYTGTTTMRATASDVEYGVRINPTATMTAANQQFHALHVDPTLGVGGQTGTVLNAIKAIGRVQINDFLNTGTTGTLVLNQNNGNQIASWSADAIYRIGNAGSAAQMSPTSDGTTTSISGNSILWGVGTLGMNVVSNSGAGGAAGNGAIKSRGSVAQTSGALPYYSYECLQVINQTAAATGDVVMFEDNTTLTAIIGNLYGVRIKQASARNSFGVAAPTAKLQLGGAVTATTWTTVGIQLALDAATYTDSGTAGTRATGVSVAINRPTFASTNAVTITDAATLYISNDVAAGTNMTLTRTHALWVAAGISRFDGKVQIGSGISVDGAGMKHSRVTTGSVAAGTTALVTITWTTAFADANYTVNASVIDSTTSSLSLSVVHVESVTASAVTVRVANNAIGSLTGTVQVIACHD